MTHVRLMILASLMGAASPATAALSEKDRTAAVTAAIQVIGSDPAKAVAQADLVIADLDTSLAKPDASYVCTTDATDTLTKLLGATIAGKGTTIAVSYDYCWALFAKGFALIDLRRGSEAEPFLRRASAMAPDNAHFLNEYAEWHKSARQWQTSYDLFAKSAAMADAQPADERAKRHARALRGMGFNLIELGRLDDAEAKFNESLKLESGNRNAVNELKYIAELRAKAKAK